MDSDPTKISGAGWRKAFKANEKDETERVAKERGSAVEWLEGDCIKVTTLYRNYMMCEKNPAVNVVEVSINEQKYYDSVAFPLVLSPDPPITDGLTPLDCCDWVRKNGEHLKDKLFKHAAILFRNFAINTPEDFDAFVKSFGLANFPYLGGGANRKHVTGNVFTANEAPPHAAIPFHHEMAYTSNGPTVLFFYCDVAPSSGGETSIVRSNLAYEYMLEREPALVQRLETEGVRYVRVYSVDPDPNSILGPGWKAAFKANEKNEAERVAKERGSTVEWLEGDCMKVTTKVMPAMRVDDRTGKKMWYNSISVSYMGIQDSRNDRKKSVLFGSGDLLPENAMETMRATLDELAVNFPWQQGDVLIVDNRQALHARRPFSPPRRVLACLCKD